MRDPDGSVEESRTGASPRSLELAVPSSLEQKLSHSHFAGGPASLLLLPHPKSEGSRIVVT
jgi:hypothetical protein